MCLSPRLLPQFLRVPIPGPVVSVLETLGQARTDSERKHTTAASRGQRNPSHVCGTGLFSSGDTVKRRRNEKRARTLSAAAALRQANKPLALLALGVLLDVRGLGAASADIAALLVRTHRGLNTRAARLSSRPLLSGEHAIRFCKLLQR